MLSNKKNTSLKYKIKKESIEWICILLLMVFSFINAYTLSISLLILLILLLQKEVGAIKIINIITLRTIINPGFAVDISQTQNLKWIILLGCSLYLISSFLTSNNRFEIKKVYGVIVNSILFTIYNMFVAVLFSSLPTIAIFKLFSYIIIFLGTFVGIGITYKKFNWHKWMYKLLSFVILLSVVLIPFSIGYLRTGRSFQGITNHPNMFGILAALFIAIFLSYSQINRIGNKNKYKLWFIPLTLYMVILSQARTSLITISILLLFFVLFSRIKIIYKFINIYLVIIFSLLVLMTNNPVFNFIYNFLHKNQSDFLDSRLSQIDRLTTNFLSNPLFGKGFAVPVLPYKSFEFNFNYIVEPGNLILAVLSYSGIIGFIIFLVFLLQIFLGNIKSFRYNCFLPISVILVNMGEMVFFSSNNIGVWCYMFFGLYFFSGDALDDA